MIQKVLYAHFSNVADGNNHKTQREYILHLLKDNDFVATASLRLIAYQYNARIYELRKGIHNGWYYDIEAVKQDGVFGFRMLGKR